MLDLLSMSSECARFLHDKLEDQEEDHKRMASR